MNASSSAPDAPLVLVVDDDLDILDAICDILESDRYRVARARHGAEALERVSEERPAVVLLDLMMPVMDGVAFAQALRKRPGDAEVPLVVISADGNPQRIAAVGAQAFLAKPFGVDLLLAHVAAAVAAAPGRRPRAATERRERS